MMSGLFFTGITCAVCAIWKREILSLYTVNPEVLSYAEVRMIHAVAFLWLCNVYEISGGALRGMGYSTLPAVIILLGCCVLRIVWVYTVFRIYNNFAFLMDVYPVSWLITGIVTTIFYYWIRKRVFA